MSALPRHCGLEAAGAGRMPGAHALRFLKSPPTSTPPPPCAAGRSGLDGYWDSGADYRFRHKAGLEIFGQRSFNVLREGRPEPKAEGTTSAACGSLSTESLGIAGVILESSSKEFTRSSF
jgi:hypothetical protein